MKPVCGTFLSFNVGDPVGLLWRTHAKDVCTSYSALSHSPKWKEDAESKIKSGFS